MKNLLITGMEILIVVLCFCLVVTFTPGAAAQTTFGNIIGTVSDTSGGALEGAQVTLTNQETDAKLPQTTGSDGLYQFSNLLPGRYRIDVEKPGFKHTTQPDIVVQVQQTSSINLTMQVGDVSQTVEVTSETPLLQPDSSSLGQVIDERKTNEIPLNGRNVFNLITLSPAAIAQGGSGGSQVGQNPFSWGNYQVGGSFGNESAEYIDGQPVNIGYINLPILIPDQDSISEFKVQYNNLGPEWGKFAGGIVNLSTKGGSNEFHGVAYEYLRNKVLNAKPFFSTTNPPYVQNQYGGTIGGPVIKEKTFFFFAYDGYRQRASSVFTTTVPTASERTGVFPADVPIFHPLSISAACSATNVAACNRTQFANNTIPTALINPAAAVELKFIPAPTNGSEINNYTSAAASGGNTGQYVGRVDQNLSSTQHIFARYNFFSLLDLPTDPFRTGLCADRCSETYQTNAAVIDYSNTIRPDLILNINGSGSRFHYLRSPTNSNFDLTQYGWPSSYNTLIPAAGRSPFTPCFTPQDPTVTCSQGQSFITDHDTQFAFQPNITWIKGRHTFQFGGQLIETYDNYAQTNIASGAFAFNGSWTNSNAVSGGTGGISFADFLLGYGLNQSTVFNHSYGEAQVPGLVAQKETYRGFYFGDTWRVTRKLTLNYGLRYDLPGAFSVRHDFSTYWDPSATNPSVTGAILNAGSTNIRSVTETKCTFTAGSPTGALNCPTNGPFGPTVNGPLGRGNVSAFDAGQGPVEAPFTNYHPGYVQQFNLDIQRELPWGIFVDAAYAGSRGVHLPNPTQTGIDQIPDQDLALQGALVAQVPNPFIGISTVSPLNPTTNPTINAGQLLRPYPQYTNVSLAGDGCCNNNYNSFQLTVTKRFHGGGSFLSAYTNANLIRNTSPTTPSLNTSIT